MAWHEFGGWKRPLFGDLHTYGEQLRMSGVFNGYDVVVKILL